MSSSYKAVYAARMTDERVPPVDGGFDAAPHALEDGDSDLQVDGAVFHYEYGRPAFCPADPPPAFWARS